MSYEEIIYMIDATKKHHRRAIKELAKVLKNFAADGWHDEHLAEEYYERENNLYCATNNLIGRLPTLAVAAER